MTEFLLDPVFFLAAFLAAIGVAFCLMRFMHVFGSKGEILPYVFYLAAFINMLEIIIEGRNMFVFAGFSEIESTPLTYVPPSYLVWIGRIQTSLVLFVACQRIASRLLHYGSQPNTPTLLIISFLFFFFTNVVTAIFFGAHPSFKHEYLFLVVVGTACLLFDKGEEETAVCAVRNAFFIFLVISAGFIFWKPGLVLSNNYLEGLIPGLTYRYAGLTSHANTLGVMIVLFMLCIWSKPFSSRFINFFGWAIGFSSLVLTQSKTCWIILIISMCCMGYFRYGHFLKRRLFDQKAPILPAFFILGTMIVTSILAGVVMFSDIVSKVHSFFSTSTGAALMTMTGRDMIWEAALNEWRHSPFFGYGLTIWDEAHRTKLGMPWAVTAHNQFYQTLASSGIVGVAGLLVYVLTLFWFTLKTAKSSQGLTLALFLMLLFRSMSEVSIPLMGHFGPDFLINILLLMIIGAQFNSDSIKKPDDSPKT